MRPSSLPAATLLLASLAALCGCSGAPTPTPAPQGALVTFSVAVPASTPADARLDIKGNQPEFGDWYGDDDGLVLTKGADGRYTASARFAPGTQLEFKVRRSSWATVMKAADGSELPNLTHTVAGDATVSVTVAMWADQVPRPSSLSGTFETLEVPAGFGLAARTALVYLPPGYATDTARRYPVLYMHDGQNVFDVATAYAGEWKADEAAQAGIAAGKVEPLLIVAVYNTPARLDEYTPVRDTGVGAGGQADAYGQLLVQTVKPLVDARFRTRTDAASTGLAGSSLGGLATLYLGMKYPDVFTRLGVVSPSVWWANRDILARVSALPAKLPPRTRRAGRCARRSSY